MSSAGRRDHDSSADYDAVAELYDRAFQDIRVRRDEWKWLSKRMDQVRDRSKPPRVLDLGCGNGALLVALASRIESGIGVDISTRAIRFAQHNSRHCTHLSFQPIVDAQLPFPDQSFDLVISFLSFRYLDWDASLREIKRVLAPNGRLFVIDMASQRVRPTELPLLLRSGIRHLVRPLRDSNFHRNVAALTAHPDWHRMLQRNPMRTERDYRDCFARFFPGRRLEVLNTTFSKRVIAFDSGPLSRP
jgi:ubiquinone/menaquinone biosynthesis C-methylase UbiE